LSDASKVFYAAHPELRSDQWDSLLRIETEKVNHLASVVARMDWSDWGSPRAALIFENHPQLLEMFLERMLQPANVATPYAAVRNSLAPAVLAMICQVIVDNMGPLMAELDLLDTAASFLSGGIVSQASMYDFVSGLMMEGIFEITEAGVLEALSSNYVGEFMLPNVEEHAHMAVHHFYLHLDAMSAQLAATEAALLAAQQAADAAVAAQQALEAAALLRELEVDPTTLMVDMLPAIPEAIPLGIVSVCALFSIRAQLRIIGWFSSGGWDAILETSNLDRLLESASLSIGFTPGGFHDVLFRKRVRLIAQTLSRVAPSSSPPPHRDSDAPGGGAPGAAPSSPPPQRDSDAPDGGAPGAAAGGSGDKVPVPSQGGGSMAQGDAFAPAGVGGLSTAALGCVLWWMPQDTRVGRKCPHIAGSMHAGLVSLLSLLPMLGYAAPPFHAMLGPTVSASLHMDGAPWVPRFAQAAWPVVDAPSDSARLLRHGFGAVGISPPGVSYDRSVASFSSVRPPEHDELPRLVPPLVGSATTLVPQVELRVSRPLVPVPPQGMLDAARLGIDRRGVALRNHHSHSVSSFALHPTDVDGFAEVSDRVAHLLASSYAPSTDRMDAGY